MQILKRFVILITLAAFVCAATGCATNGRGVASTKRVEHSRSNAVKTVEEDSSGSSTALKALAIGVGAIAVIGVLALAAGQGGGQDFPGGMLMH